LLAGDHKQGIGAAGTEGGQQPGADQDKFVLVPQIEERRQLGERSTTLRDRQGQQSSWPAKVHRRLADHLPSVRTDVHRTPACVREIEINVTIVLGDPDMDGPFGAIKLRPRLE
jgi:hypothetical protein